MEAEGQGREEEWEDRQVQAERYEDMAGVSFMNDHETMSNCGFV